MGVRDREGGSKEPGHSGNWRQIALLLLFLGTIAFLVLGLTSPREFGAALASATWYWAVASVLFFAASFYLWALLYKVSFLLVGLASATPELLGPLLVSIFLNTAAPVGEAIFVEHAVERGRPGAQAAAAVILAIVIDLATTLPFVVWGLWFLWRSAVLPAYDIVVSLLFTLLILLLVAVLWMAKAKSSWLEAFLRVIQRAANRTARLLRQQGWTSQDWITRNVTQFSAASTLAAGRPGLLMLSIAVGLLFHMVNCAGLYLLFLAFGETVAPGTAVAGFSMSLVLNVIAITPQGIGPTESVMSLLFLSMGVPAAVAVVVAVGYRILNIWVPVVLGYLFARRMRVFGGRGRPQGGVSAP